MLDTLLNILIEIWHLLLIVSPWLLIGLLIAYPLMLVISVPLYICAIGAVPIAAALLTKGLMPGAALAFLIAGPATNTITLAFVGKKMGKKVEVYFDEKLVKVDGDIGENEIVKQIEKAGYNIKRLKRGSRG